MFGKCKCDDEMVLEAQGGDAEGVSSCKCPVSFSRKGTWIGLGVAAAATGALLYFANRERGRLEEQVKATLPLQT